uniref:Uncharacterized protein n=1 Tax=Pithovirus LCPAC302 TaxID=2506593 RepID=A0A481Z6M4_9VIRU|nr:MAG: hypothetical protein LCPAC302_01540 [Pithovirus LCPAC302]
MSDTVELDCRLCGKFEYPKEQYIVLTTAREFSRVHRISKIRKFEDTVECPKSECSGKIVVGFGCQNRLGKIHFSRKDEIKYVQ